MADLVLYFSTNKDTMMATKALRDGGVAARMLPVPANVPTSANLCLSISSVAETAALAALKAGSVAVGGILR